MEPMEEAMDFNSLILDDEQFASNDGNLLNYFAEIQLEKPVLKILVQPVDKFRFRYKSEMMGTHGNLLGEKDTGSHRKELPTVKLENFPYRAIIRCTLVTSDEENRIPHAHRLVRKEGNHDADEPHDVEVSKENNYTAVFHGMGIIHTAKKNLKDELVRKKKMLALFQLRQTDPNAIALSIREEMEILAEAEAGQKDMNLNSVALSFQAFIEDGNVLKPITDIVYTNPISNLKSALTGELKICRIDKCFCSCEGNEEVFMLVEKVGKKNIKVKFYELDEENKETWCDYGKFSELDVHHQYAIVFRTPPYKDLQITTPKKVFIKLERPSDGECSNSLTFIYQKSEKFSDRRRHRESLSKHLDPISTLPANENAIKSRTKYENFSPELLDLFKQATHCPEELIKIMEDKETANYFNDYTMFIDDPNLGFDGSESEEAFASDTMKKLVEIIKENAPNSKYKIKSLLEETASYGETRLHSALRYGLMQIAERILMVVSSDPYFLSVLDLQNNCGKTPLHFAVSQNDSKIVKGLLLLGANPEARDYEGNTPLYYAVQMPEAGASVDVFLALKKNAGQCDEKELSSLLRLATKSGSMHAVKSLIKAGADVNSTEPSSGHTALHLAVEGVHKDIVSYLLTKTEIDVNHKNMMGNTALHYAVVNTGSRAKEICNLLIQHGANPHISNRSQSGDYDSEKTSSVDSTEIKSEKESEDEDERGQTPFDLAENRPEVTKVLMGENDDDSSLSEVSIKQEENCLDEGRIVQLAAILDESKGWMKLAEKMGYTFLVNLLKENTESSAALTVINYALGKKDDDVTPEKMLDVLKEIGEDKAAAELTKILYD